MTPMLILVFGVTPVTAIGTDLAYAAVTKTVGGYKHLTQKTVNMTLSSWMAIGSVPAAVCGVYVLGLLEDWAGRDFEDIVISTLPKQTSKWLRRDLIHQVEKLGLPVTAVVPRVKSTKQVIDESDDVTRGFIGGGII